MNALSLLDTLLDQAYGVSCDAVANEFDSPRVDVRETKDAYIFDMDLPGHSENDVQLELHDNVLTIASIPADKKTEKKEAKAASETNWLLHERRAGSFKRRFTLPQDIDQENVQATFKNGVLNITIGRKFPPQARQITITAA